MSQSRSLKLGVLVSGRGTNLQAIIDAIQTGKLQAEIAVVVSNHKDVPALQRAQRYGIPTVVLEERDFATREGHHHAVGVILESYGVELVVLAGWDRIVHPTLVQRFAGHMMNIHPSLLPAFGGGMHAQRDAWEWGVKVSGATIHFVTEEVDSGPIILQEAVPVLEDDTPERLAERILEVEHQLLPRAIQFFAEGRLVIEERRVRILTKEQGRVRAGHH